MDTWPTINSAQKKLNGKNNPFIELFKHGCLTVEYCQPQKVDHQTPLTRGKINIVASGNRKSISTNLRKPFEPGEVFLPKGGERPELFIKFYLSGNFL